MNQSGLNLVNVKTFNRCLILQQLCIGGPQTRQQLAAQCHLSSMTVTNLVSDLLEAGIVTEAAGPGHDRPGRSPRTLMLAPESPVVLGIWLSKDGLRGAVFDLALNQLYNSRICWDATETSSTVLEKLKGMTATLAQSSSCTVLGLGLAVIGVVDGICGEIRYATDFFEIQSLELTSYLHRFFDFPIFVGNDSQASGLAELYFGHGRTIDDFIYVGIDNGSGSAIVADRKLQHTPISSCGELGHMSIDFEGPLCACGNRGCLELYTSATSLLRQINEACGTSFSEFSEAVAYARHASKAYAILHRGGLQLARALNTLCNIMGIPTIILGHAGYYFPDEILILIESVLNRISVLKHTRRFRLLRTSFQDTTPLRGAGCLVLEQVFNAQLPFLPQ